MITDVTTECVIAADDFPAAVVSILLEIDEAASGVEAVEQGINFFVVSSGRRRRHDVIQGRIGGIWLYDDGGRS
jgi:hypothetical protein